MFARSPLTLSVPLPPAEGASSERRLKDAMHAHYKFLWRAIRRLGSSEAEVDDAVQQSFIVLSRRLDAIEPGKERAFLFGTALRMASHYRRSAIRRQRLAQSVETLAPSEPSQEDVLERRRSRELLDEIIAAIPMDLRTVFVLFELEQQTMAQISELLDLPPGTVASRLRRARAHFAALAAEVRRAVDDPSRGGEGG